MKKTLKAKKLMSVLLLMVMLMSMLPAAYAEGGTEPEIIQSFTADVPEFAVIGAPCKAYVKDNPDEGYTAKGTWMQDGNVLAETDTFRDNTQYTYHLVVKPREGYKLADNFTHDYGRAFLVEKPDKDGNYVKDFSYLPISAAPAAKVIDELTVTLPAAPVAGEKSHIGYGRKDNDYYYNMCWFENGSGMLDGQEFKPDTVYSAAFEFKAINGCTFAETVQVAGLEENPHIYSRLDENTLTFSYKFPATGPAQPVPGEPSEILISSIALTGPKAPVTGEAVSDYSVTGTGYTAEGKWFVGESEVTEENFKPETVYTLAVTVTAVEGFSFKALESLTMDGEDVSVTKGLAQADVLHFLKTYPATASLPELEIQAVARIVRDGKNFDFETFDAAFKESRDGEEILLLKSCDTDAGINLDKNIIVSALEGLPKKPVLSFTTYGMALWGKSITFNNIDIVMNGVGSTPYTGEWNWMTVCGNANSEIILNNSNMNMDGQNLNKHAIYADSGMHLVLNGSNLTIKNYVQDALEWNGGSFNYNVEMINSHYISDRNRSGFTGTFNVKTQNSTIDVINSRGNGSNGSNFEFINSTINFNANGSHGLSAGNLTMDNSVVNANGNGGNGVHVAGTLTVKNGTQLTISNNICKISSKWTKPGALLLAGNGSISGSTVTITGNSGSGIHQCKEKNLLIDDTTALTVTNNKAVKLGMGGGIAAAGSVQLPKSAVLYNNHADGMGDDVALYEDNSKISLGSVGSGWTLDGTEGTNDCLRAIDGWYRDEEDAERPAPMAAEAAITSGRWNAHSLEKLFVKEVQPGTITGPVFLKAAHGIGEKKVETPSELKFVKTDSVTGKPIKGAEFTLYSDENLKTVKASYVSDEKGEFTISELPGSYYLKETKPAEGYRNNNTVYHVNIKPEIVEEELRLDTSLTPNEVYRSIKSMSCGYVENMEPDSTGRYVITNDFINEKEIEIEKIWRDKEGMRARTQSVEVALYADKEEYEVFTLSDANKWSVKLTVPKYDETGKEIEYTVRELTKVKDYNVSYEGFKVINTHRLYNPKTGDESNILLWTAILLATAAAAGGVSYVLIKKKKD